MAHATRTERDSLVQAANVNLHGWLERVYNVQRSLDNLFTVQGYGNFTGFRPWFPQAWLPEGMSLEVRPQGDVELEGEIFSSTAGPRPHDATYTEDNPFTRGAMLNASIKAIFAEQNTHAAMLLHCLQAGPNGERGLIPHYEAEGVVIPAHHILDGEVELTIVDIPASPSQSGPYLTH